MYQEIYSPILLFCLSLTPIVNIFKQANTGYNIGDESVSYCLYIADLKKYARNSEEMEKFKALIKEFGVDIYMAFGLNKYDTIHMIKGKIKKTDKAI